MHGASKNIFITGATGGIGALVVTKLLADGWTVFAATRRPETLPRHDNIHPIMLDLTQNESIQAAVQEVTVACGEQGLQALVNMAGIIVQGPLETLPMSELRRQFEVNVFAPVALTQQLLPLIRKGEGRIINVTASSIMLALPAIGAISASKVAFAFLSDSFRQELAAWHIPVVNIIPGAFDTSIFATAAEAFEATQPQLTDAQRELYAAQVNGAKKALAQQQLGDPEEVATVLVQAVTVQTPEPEYYVGADAVAIRDTFKNMPVAQRDVAIAQMFGLQ